MIPWHYKAGAGLIVMAAYSAFVWHLGGLSARLGAAQAENKALAGALDDMSRLNKERVAAQARADKLAALPPKVIERVRTNPSGCTVPAPVADGLRDQVRQTNDAVRAVR